MGKRVSHSLLDPFMIPLVPRLYRVLPIPRRFPPEGIILIGHLLAITGAVGFAYAVTDWWGGVLVAIGVAGNHIADMVDGTHARSTDQCRNGGELLDHFTDPLSFSYWMIGLAVSCQSPYLGIITIVCIYATAVLTNIKAKIMGEFSLAAFGPTEFKTLLVLYGIAMSIIVATAPVAIDARTVALWSLRVLAAVGVLQLILNLVRAVIDVNRSGEAPDTTNWEVKS